MAGQPFTIFDVAQRGMSAQLVRMNAAASNLANAGTVSGSEADAYKPIRAVFAEDLDRASGLATVQVQGVVREQAAAVREHNPDHPLADENGDVWAAPVDENAEMVEMLEASRQYQNMVEALSTAKQLMLDTMRLK
ncbi:MULTISPECIES: flagellar basal body rod protein FlgC [Novosphingobium]|uniref:Flagellar basal-body rod protein FlgC n=1 Tax=Novosphingobium pentaromativorans US6-1 TaxID=1088721 RepID=G6EAI6_9SPHN|nr:MULTISPECIES: flagellar basal body rod protein FlgC [Novosphingobium]AIT80661.1 flagellar basal body rod protein FlgC [Novosphingobium pentaromativorans US6-1]EHJ61623.1 flagellar basal-body rod protein FlgC [Novosphingobium pentaromativorans US6-1]GFM27756.1 flagellar basal-body rod protein FlgC [Novosphingobium sp. PY1]CCA94152.1 flagellar basal-body rod protein FlgC [Novosphingobium sp. PP1Y]